MAGKSKQKKKRQDTGFLDDYVDVRYAGEPDPVSSNEFTLLINNEEMGEWNRRNNSNSQNAGSVGNGNQIVNNGNAGNRVLRDGGMPERDLEPGEIVSQNNVNLAPQNEIPAPQEVIRVGGDNQSITNAKACWKIKKQANGAYRVDSSPDNPLGIVPMRDRIPGVDERSMEYHHQVRKDAGKHRKIMLCTIGGIYQGIKIIPNARMLVNVQEKRHHNMVPGRDEETFEENPGEGDILDDFRRVPTVWSRPTAARATDERNNDLPPKVSVYVYQPEPYWRNTTMANGSTGHSMLGIEYTGRKPSKITGKKERYKITYGFYPGGGMRGKAAGAMTGRGTEVPGQLRDDDDHSYHISKTYTVTREQAVKIAEASEKYTEKGGYGSYTRNCTTFVRDMFRAGSISDTAIDTIFTEEPVRLFNDESDRLGQASRWYSFADANTKWKMASLTKQEDLSYQGWGNRRATIEEVRKYNKTKNSIHGKIITAISPTDAGENIRNMTDVEGQLGSYMGSEVIVANGLYGRAQNIRSAGKWLADAISGSIISQADINAIGGEFSGWFTSLFTGDSQVGNSLFTLWREASDALRARDDLPAGARAPFHSLVTQEQIKQAYASLEQQMADVSKYYQKFLFSDSRINREVMNLLSHMQHGLVSLDYIYQAKKKAKDEGELGTLRENMLTQEYTVRVGNTQVSMTPTHYESYLQIYKKPDAAVSAYARYKHLKLIGEAMNKDEKKEYDKLCRAENLANQLDLSHREMLNKDKFSQSDIDYAFRLRDTENASSKDRSSGTMFTGKASASMTYINLMYDKVYGGIQDEVRRDVANGKMQSGATWLNKYLLEKTAAKPEEIVMILRGIKHVLDSPTAPRIARLFHGFLKDHYLQRALPANESRGWAVQSLGIARDNCYNKMLGDQMDFPKLIDMLSITVLQEKEEKKPKAARR